MTYRLRNIAVALGLALVAALLTTFYVTNYKRHVRASESTVKVFVAKQDIPQGTLGADLIKRGWITPAEVLQRSVVPGAISSPDQVASSLSTQPIYAGEQVSMRRFADHAQQGVRAQLHGTLRALSLPGTGEQLLLGTLKDGDHVDLIANLKTGTCPTCFATRVVSRDLLVLRAPQTSTAKVPGTAASVLLATSDRRDAQKVFFAVQNAAGWSLELRPVANAQDSPEDVESTQSMVTDNVNPNAMKHFNGSGK